MTFAFIEIDAGGEGRIEHRDLLALELPALDELEHRRLVLRDLVRLSEEDVAALRGLQVLALAWPGR